MTQTILILSKPFVENFPYKDCTVQFNRLSSPKVPEKVHVRSIEQWYKLGILNDAQFDPKFLRITLSNPLMNIQKQNSAYNLGSIISFTSIIESVLYKDLPFNIKLAIQHCLQYSSFFIYITYLTSFWSMLSKRISFLYSFIRFWKVQNIQKTLWC